jgi:predicted enzyme related to lactoylglutathione lyase
MKIALPLVSIALPAFLAVSCMSKKPRENTMQIKQVMVFVDDLEKAKEFYGKTLGLEIQDDLSKELGMLILKSSTCLFTIHGGFPKQAHSDHRKISITLGVENIHQEVSRLKQKGVTLIGDIEETPVHWFQAFLDPSGNMLEIGQYK